MNTYRTMEQFQARIQLDKMALKTELTRSNPRYEFVEPLSRELADEIASLEDEDRITASGVLPLLFHTIEWINESRRLLPDKALRHLTHLKQCIEDIFDAYYKPHHNNHEYYNQFTRACASFVRDSDVESLGDDDDDSNDTPHDELRRTIHRNRRAASAELSAFYAWLKNTDQRDIHEAFELYLIEIRGNDEYAHPSLGINYRERTP